MPASAPRRPATTPPHLRRPSGSARPARAAWFECTKCSAGLTTTGKASDRLGHVLNDQHRWLAPFGMNSPGYGVGVIDRRRKGWRMAQGKERTKDELLKEAKRLGIKGRSKMNKGALKAAVERRR